VARELKVGTAAMVDPKPTPVISPAVTLAARRTAALPGHRGLSLNIALAVMPPTIIRGTRELHGLVTAPRIVAIAISIPVAVPIPVAIPIPIAVPISVVVVIAITDGQWIVHQEICTASTVDPNTILIEPPCRALCTR